MKTNVYIENLKKYPEIIDKLLSKYNSIGMFFGVIGSDWFPFWKRKLNYLLKLTNQNQTFYVNIILKLS